ncbi:glycosyltransferase family 4 protein [Methylobacterium sp. BTF04]|uniref:glycosyltransferase family 4 protein n=1 Tax=Methylobacterium sp. BTF04 TaxID=2708300 RepID=UPI0013D35DE8|nr:glycosyltransferase family 4 protein [Methylobacterium sp. BTF04]NEU13478.1 glycosyltransferase family 4 protein [Methylobacterium sp. BTF04]
MTARHKVLVIAEAANPEWVSVPLIGWSMASALRAVADVHIVTQIRNRDAFVRAGLVEGRDFTALDTEAVARPAYALAGLLRGGEGKGWTTLAAIASLTYPYFERAVWRQFGAAISAHRYDVVHRITPLTPTTGSSLAARCARAGVPFVLGPLNGGLPWPKQFSAERRQEKEWLSYVRSLYKLMPRRIATLSAASAILAGSRHTAREIPADFDGKLIYMPENGIDPERFAQPPAPPATTLLRMCFIGRLVPYKGPDMAIMAALPLLRAGRAHLDIIGDGPMRADLVGLVAREGVGEAVTFHGWVAHGAVQNVACRSSVFVFPSVREFGGGAVLEAMALGLAPVVVDYGGPGELLSDERGFAVPLASREAIVAGLSEILWDLAAAPDRVGAVGRAARAWAMSRLTWSAKANAMRDVYDWVTGRRSEKPCPY